MGRGIAMGRPSRNRVAIAGAVAIVSVLAAVGLGTSASAAATSDRPQTILIHVAKLGKVGGHRVLMIAGKFPRGLGGEGILFREHRGKRGPRGFAGVIVSGRSGSSRSSASYTSKAVVTRKRIVAELGDLGRISVRMHPRRVRTGEGAEITRGVYRGRIRFKGEDHYIDIDRAHVRGATALIDLGLLERTPPAAFRSLVDAVPRRLASADVTAYRQSRSIYTELGYRIRSEGDEQTGRFTALTAETRDGVSITRSREGRLPSSSLVVAPDLTTATLTGSGMLAGAAEFISPGLWDGDLHTSMPGDPWVRLAGPKFRADVRLGL